MGDARPTRDFEGTAVGAVVEETPIAAGVTLVPEVGIEPTRGVNPTGF